MEGAVPVEARHDVTLAERRMAKCLAVLMVWLFALVIAGGLVRYTGSGMSIPDWPFIKYSADRHSILPPFNEADWETVYQTFHREYYHPKVAEDAWMDRSTFRREFWTEYSHRAIAKTFAIPFLAIFIATFVVTPIRRRIGWLMLGAALLFPAQAILGGLVVIGHTPVLKVASHLTTAFVAIGLVLWMLLKLMSGVNASALRPSPRLLALVGVALALCLLQVFSGGLVAKSKAGYFYNTWPLLGESLIPPSAALYMDERSLADNLSTNHVLIQFIHRWLAFVAAAGVVTLVAVMLPQRLTSVGRWAVRSSILVLVAQITLGIMTLLWAVPVALAMGHLFGGLLLYLVVVILAFEVVYNPALSVAPLGASANARSSEAPVAIPTA